MRNGVGHCYPYGMKTIRRALPLLMLALAVFASCTAGSQAPMTQRDVVTQWVDTPVGKAVRRGPGPDGPAVLSRVNPYYPDIDRQSGRYGVVRMEVVIDETGGVSRAQALEAPSPTLADAATEAVRQWKFAVTSVDGRPVRVVMPVVINFRP